jgi:hypothetical protein
MDWNIFTIWYGSIGWIIVDSFIFAFAEAVLLVLALRAYYALRRRDGAALRIDKANSRDHSSDAFLLRYLNTCSNLILKIL